MRIADQYKPTLFFLLLAVIAATYFDQMWLIYPSGIHAWAQADRLSLAIKFYDNGMDFFKPATFNLMSRDGVTGVEFPIQSYLAAAAGKALGREYISVAFRVINTLISIAGLSCLFVAVYKRTKDFLFSAITPVFLFCSPVFLYYTCNYLPDSASTSLLLIGFAYILNYFDDKKNTNLIKAFLWFTIAALIKTSAALYIMGFTGFVFLNQLIGEKKYAVKHYLPIIGTAIVSVSILAGYFIFSRHLNKEYGDSGVFMAKAKPFVDMDKFNYFINHSLKDVWIKEYFVLPEYLFFAALFVPAFSYLRKDSFGKQQLYLLLVFLLGSLGVAYLMGMQLIGHDYYAIVIFFPTITFALLIAVVVLYKQLKDTAALQSVKRGILASLILMYCFANYQIHQRLYPDYYPFNPGVPWAAGGNNILDSLHISRQEKIAVFDDDPCNLALYYFDRMGHTIRPGDWNGNTVLADSLIKSTQTHILVLSASKISTLQTVYGDHFNSKFKQLYYKDSIAIYQSDIH
jgi:hypothetical protein